MSNRQGMRPFVLAGVAAVVATVVASCGIPNDAAPRPITRGSVPSYRLIDPSAPSTTTTTVRPAVAVPETVYLVGPGQHLVAVSRDVALPATLNDILGALLDGPTQAETSFGLQSFLSGPPTKVTATVTNGIASVDFSTNPVQVVGPDQILAIAQVVFTATEQPGITGVVFHIAGKPIEVPTASGAQVPGPVNRATYAAEAPVVPTATTATTAPN